MGCTTFPEGFPRSKYGRAHPQKEVNFTFDCALPTEAREYEGKMGRLT